ncbi:MAG: molybdopterin converting factor subunit 1 [Bacteroidota bacterium]
MNITIKTFGITRDILGGREVTVDLPGNTVAELRQLLTRKHPELLDLRSLMIAVNNSYAQEHQEINETDEIALIPPVSGG